MDPQEYQLQKRSELVSLAKAMLEDRVQLIEGVRRICDLQSALSHPKDEVFTLIRGIESETDHFPIGEFRAQCADEYLQRMDLEIEEYLADTRGQIREACQEIIQLFS